MIALVLGGTFPHIALLENLKKRGYYTILIDYYENPIAKKSADEHICESTLDQNKILDIARLRDADLVISTCIDQANVTACYVAEKLCLPLPYGYETALNVSNKILMKSKMRANNIPTSKFYHVVDLKTYRKEDLLFPVVVKPADSNSSKGVRVAENNEELYRYVKDALHISRNNEAVVEEYKTGREIGIDCFIKNKKASVLMTKERRKMKLEDDTIQQIFGCVWPADLTEKQIDIIKIIADKIANAFDLDNTPLMIQAIVDENDINVIEFAPRIGGGESFRIIELSTEFDIIDAAVDSFLNLQVTLNHKNPQMYYAENFIYAQSGFFGKITGHQNLLESKKIEYLNSYKTIGMEIGKEMSSNNRVGVFAVKSASRNKLLEKINIAIKHIDVFDVHGESIMRKDIYR